MIARMATRILSFSFVIILVASTHSESEPFDLTSLSQAEPISNNTTPPLRGRGNDNDQHSDQSQNGHTPSQQVASPRQECPTDPPVDCNDLNCDGSRYPPDPYRCRSRTTTIMDSVEFTLFGCRCCRYPHFWCNEDECNGGSDFRCHSEIQMGCPCFDPDEEPILTPVSPLINPVTPVTPDLNPQESPLKPIQPSGFLENSGIYLERRGEGANTCRKQRDDEQAQHHYRAGRHDVLYKLLRNQKGGT